jgi:dephospho-CoA kinase
MHRRTSSLPGNTTCEDAHEKSDRTDKVDKVIVIRRVMKLVGLGGGIGAGKSTVSVLLKGYGATIVDADVIARQVVEPGTTALQTIAERFGAGVLTADGALDRQALADIVFRDPEALKDLNAITHPAIAREMVAQVEAHRSTDHIVIYDAALLFDSGKTGMVGRMVVDVDPEIAVERLVKFRGLGTDDARSRIARQMSRDDRVRLADFVIDNSSDPESLASEVGRAWAWIATLPPSPEGVPAGAVATSS